MQTLHNLEVKLRIKFKEIEMLKEALMHSSFSNESSLYGKRSNERLEYLGDAVLGCVIAKELFNRYPDLSEGQLTEFRSILVREETLSIISQSYELGTYLLLGKGENSSMGRLRNSNLANVFEAIVGAIFIDQGYELAEEFVLRSMDNKMHELITDEIFKDPKSQLQEMLQSRKKELPIYKVTEVKGPPHKLVYKVHVIVDGKVLGEGCANKKVDGERLAAIEAIAKLE